MPEIVTSSTDMPSSLTDAIGIGTLTRLVPRELVDEVVASEGRKEIRKNKLPARVMVYFVMAMALFTATLTKRSCESWPTGWIIWAHGGKTGKRPVQEACATPGKDSARR
jgi:Insertion element 4 transposase N-terminal